MSVALAAPVPAKRRLGRGVMAAYGFGAVAYGVKDSGFGTFLLLFYNQVIGLDSTTVGLVIMAALLIDAFVDPAVGFFSDRTRTRWGRRHPWMYASALPIMLGWVALWNPPVTAGTSTLVWLFLCAVVVRSAVSAYEVPSVALTPELSGDYDERTRIMAWRYLFGWAGGLLIGLSVYLYFLAPTPDYPNGLLRRAGYMPFAITGAVAMGVAILVSAMGTHGEIPHLPQPAIERQTLRQNFAQLFQTMQNRAFAILMLAGLAAYTNQGIAYALANYMNAYVWGFKGFDFVLLTLASFAGVVIAFVVAPVLGKRGDKGRAALAAVLGSAFFLPLPFWLRLAGAFPPPGTPELLYAIMANTMVQIAFGVTAFILAASMMADVVEDSEAKTGRRSEGVFFAGSFFVQKCTSGVGIFLAGLILAAAGFPAKAMPGTVPEAVIDRLTMIYGGCYIVLALTAAFFFSRFPFGRNEHEARLARLAGAASVDAAPRL